MGSPMTKLAVGLLSAGLLATAGCSSGDTETVFVDGGVKIVFGDAGPVIYGDAAPVIYGDATVVFGDAGPVVSGDAADPVDRTPLSIEAGGPRSVVEGATFELAVGFTPAAGASTHTATIAWGDGTTEVGVVDATEGTISGSHTYTDDLQGMVTVTIADDLGGSVSDGFELTVVNAPPTVTVGSSENSDGTLDLTMVSFVDPSADDTHTASIDWGDGTTEAGTIAANAVTGSHTYTADGSYLVAVTVTDDDGGTDTGYFAVHVMRAATPPANRVELTVGAATGAGPFVLPVNMASIGAAEAAAIQVDVFYDRTLLELTEVRPGGAATAANKRVTSLRNRVLVFGDDATAIGDGTLVELVFTADAAAAGMTVPIELVGGAAASPTASAHPTLSSAGDVVVP